MKPQLAALGLAIWVLGTGSVLAAPTVTGYELISTTRTGRTSFEYTYRVRVTNNDAALLNTRGQATSSSPLVTMVDGQAQFGNIAAGAAALSIDTVTIRQDRAGAIDASALVWTFASDTPPPAAAEGLLLPGSAAALASSATSDYLLDNGVDGSSIFEPVPGVLQTRARVVLRMRPDATVGQVNAALTAVAGRIVGMQSGSVWLEIGLPPASQSDTALAQLDGAGVFEVAYFASIPQPDAEQVNGNVGVAAFKHHLAVGGGAAPAVGTVLATRSAPAPVTLILLDDFGRGAPSFDGVQTVPDDYSSFSGTCAITYTGSNGQQGTFAHRNGHGYQVLSVIAGRTSQTAGLGAVGPAIRVRAVDAHGRQPQDCVTRTLGDVMRIAKDRIAQELEQGRKVIFSTSYSYYYAPGDLEQGVAEVKGILGDSAPGNPHILWIASAGNLFDAPVLKPLSLLIERDGGFTVESRDLDLLSDSSGQLRYRAGCRTASSQAGNISAIGTNVQVAFAATNQPTPQFSTVSGTSVAAPQVAGLAYLMWALRPEVTSNVIESWIVSTAISSPFGSCQPARLTSPVIDILGALLATENVRNISSASPATLPLRFALLDRGFIDARYDGKDLETYRAAASSSQEYNEADLNRDGPAQHLSSSPLRRSFDLMPITPDSISLPVLNEAPTFYGFGPFSLNENSVSDLDVLCYYAHVPGFYSMLTPLDTSERESLGCGPPAPTSTSRPNTLANANLIVGKPLVPAQLQGLCGETHPLMGCMLVNNSLNPNDPLIGSSEPNLGYWTQGAARAAPIALYQHFEIHPRGQVPTPLPPPPAGFPPDSPGAARARAASYRAAAWVLSDIWTNPGRVDGYMRTGWRGFANADIEAAGLAATGSSDAVYAQTLTIAQRSSFTATIKVTRTAMVGQMCAPRVVGERPNRARLGVAFWRRAGGSRVPATGLTPSGENLAAGRLVTFCDSDSTVPPQEACGASQLGPYFCDTTGTAPDEFTITGVIEPGTYEVIAESAGEFRTHDTIEAIADATISVVYSPLP